MGAGLARDPLFVALTRPQMFAGVTYTYFVINGVVSTEFFLIFKSAWVLLFALLACDTLIPYRLRWRRAARA